ncbi:MAG: hypothetical protein K6T86_09960 [Pirellulales bacterium]|jgi:hypothetical protein|nr:hypothetical protein [Pirellulales bacterium]
MSIDVARYHGWHGKLGSPWWATLAMVRVALLQVFRRKAYWIVLGLGLTQFLLFWSVIYAVTQLNPPPQVRERILEAFGFSAETAAPQDSGYILFMQRQSLVVMILLAFSGSLLVGADFRLQTLPFYLSRRIDRMHYIAGKLLAVAVLVSLLTWVPALLLFIEYGMFTSSLTYWVENWRVPLAVLAYGLVLCVCLSLLLVALSAWLQRAAPIAVTWSSLFTFLALLAEYLREETGQQAWALLDPWRDMRYVGRMCFGVFTRQSQEALAPWALLVLGVLCGACLLLLVRRVRAVEVVE